MSVATAFARARSRSRRTSSRTLARNAIAIAVAAPTAPIPMIPAFIPSLPRNQSAPLRSKPHSQPTSPLHLHDLIHEYHVVIHMGHDPERAGDDQQNDQHAEGKRHDVVDVVGAGRDVEEEDEV